MFRTSASSICLTIVGSVFGLGVLLWNAGEAISEPKAPVLQEYCACTCGSTKVAVKPRGTVDAVNCKGMTGKECNAGGESGRLSCDGSTIVQRTQIPPGMQMAPLQPSPPRSR